MEYRVKNWRQFQHYKDRNPPWIKLHFSLLSSCDWVLLDDASRVLAIACMLIASRNEGGIPNNPAYIKRVAYLNRTPNFNPLIECGFLELASNCKQMLADARPETETETETEKLSEKISAEPVNGSAVAYLPLANGSEFLVSTELLAELETAYPAVDGLATLKEIRAWCVTNPRKCKTARGTPAFLNRWFEKVQNHG